MRAEVITVSDRVSAGSYADRTGPMLVDWLLGAGWQVTAMVVPDGTSSVSTAVTQAWESGARLIVTTGGTGIAPRDLTPQAVQPLLSVETPGVIEAIRAAGLAAGAPGALLSRGVAGVLEGPHPRAFVVTVPGSTGAVRDAIAVLDPLLNHLASQLDGGDHEPVA